jgi:hypothetical protein
MLPRVLKAEHFPRGKSNVAILTIEYVVRGPGGDVMEPSIIVVGEGADVSDKGTNKAMTAAKKYALVQAFEIASENVADSDRTSPDTESSPLDPYLQQIQQRAIWYNREALGRVRQRAIQNGHANLVMPDGLTLLETLDAQGDELLRQMKENEQRHGEEREARDAQMRAEHPEYHRSSPDDELWQQPPSGQRQQPAAAGQASAPKPGLPNPADVEQRLKAAMEDPQAAVKRLNEIRKHFTPAVLKQVRLQTKWGQVDGNSAITFALREVAQSGQQRQQPGPATAPPAPPTEHQQAPEPAPAPEAAPQAPAQPHAPEPEPQPEPAPQAPAQPQPQAQRPQQARARRTDSDRARMLLETEVEFQAQMLGEPTLDFVAELLPAGATSVEQIQGNLKLQNFIVANRPRVLAALVGAGMKRQAEEYAALGERAPARNIERIIASALTSQSSL